MLGVPTPVELMQNEYERELWYGTTYPTLEQVTDADLAARDRLDDHTPPTAPASWMTTTGARPAIPPPLPLPAGGRGGPVS